jgi:hypothetical protein
MPAAITRLQKKLLRPWEQLGRDTRFVAPACYHAAAASERMRP